MVAVAVVAVVAVVVVDLVVVVVVLIDLFCLDNSIKRGLLRCFCQRRIHRMQ